MFRRQSRWFGSPLSRIFAVCTGLMATCLAFAVPRPAALPIPVAPKLELVRNPVPVPPQVQSDNGACRKD